MLHVIIAEDLVDHAFVEAHTVGFDDAAAAVADWTPGRAAEVCGVATSDIVIAARLYGRADKAMINHARGLEHQIMGTRNVQAAINLCLATGNLGRPGAGYGTITGQGNGQGGREHGQKCDQLPGQRQFDDPGAIEHTAQVWGVDPEEIPEKGVPIFAQLELMEAGTIRGVLNFCSNPIVSWPNQARTHKILEGSRSVRRQRPLPVGVGAARRHRASERGVGRERGRHRQQRRAGVQDQQGRRPTR